MTEPCQHEVEVVPGVLLPDVGAEFGQTGAEKEREAVVAYLRGFCGENGGGSPEEQALAMLFADEIEMGVHRG